MTVPYVAPCRVPLADGREHSDFAMPWSGMRVTVRSPTPLRPSHGRAPGSVVINPGNVLEPMGRAFAGDCVLWFCTDWFFVQTGRHAGTCVETGPRILKDEDAVSPAFIPVE